MSSVTSQQNRTPRKDSPQNTSQNPEEDERKRELKERASKLQKYIHFEANTKPRLQKLSNDVSQIQKDIEDLVAKTKKIQENIDRDKKIIEDSQLTEEFKDEREKKVETIRELEEQLSQLLSEKARILSQAEISLQNK